MGFFDWLSRFSATEKPAGDLIDLLRQTKKLNGTELRITPGVVPQAIVKGRLVPLTDMPLEAGACKNMCYILLTDVQRAEFDKNKKIKFVFGTRDVGRFETNIVSTEGKVSGIFTVFEPSKRLCQTGRDNEIQIIINLSGSDQTT